MCVEDEQETEEHRFVVFHHVERPEIQFVDIHGQIERDGQTFSRVLTQLPLESVDKGRCLNDGFDRFETADGRVGTLLSGGEGLLEPFADLAVVRGDIDFTLPGVIGEDFDEIVQDS